MKRLTSNQLNYLIYGSSLLSTGGGGTITAAKALTTKMKRLPSIIPLAQLDPDDLIITVVGVGDRDVCDPVVACRLALTTFQSLYKKRICAIIPVEIGPLSLATAIFTAGLMRLPVLDADIVGWRASPEVYLETITLADLPREPIVIANDQDQTLIIDKTSSIEASEKIMRDFAVKSGGDAYAVGYPLLVKQINRVVGNGSLSYSIQLGRALNKLKNRSLNLTKFCQINQLIKLGEGKIITSTLKSKKGFIKGEYKIKDNRGRIFKILVKNENIVLTVGIKPILTVPDSILLFDRKTCLGINNQENNLGKSVMILGKKAIPLWRSQKGLNLFNPKNLGYNVKQVLL